MRDVVLAAVVVLALQLLDHAVQLQAVVGLALGQADLAAGPCSRSSALMSLLPAMLILEIAGRSITVDHQDVALAVELHVVEEAGLEQRADRLGGAGAVDGVALLDRQVA